LKESKEIEMEMSNEQQTGIMDEQVVLQAIRQLSEAFSTFRHETNQRLATIEPAQVAQPDSRQSTETIPTPTSSAIVERGKQILPKPQMFSGDRSKYLVWKVAMKNKVLVDGVAMGLNAVNTTVYMSSFCDGQCGTYLQPYNTRIANGQMSCDEFWDFMDARFEDVHRQRRAAIEFNNFNQGNKPFNEFMAELDRLSSEAGFDGYPDNVKIDRLEEKLSAELLHRYHGVTRATLMANWLWSREVVRPTTSRSCLAKMSILNLIRDKHAHAWQT
jgi:hypothetical protein